MVEIENVPGENLFVYPGSETTLQFHGAGLGDRMIIRQCGHAFEEYLAMHGDPELGRIVVSFGAMDPAFDPDVGDRNVFWWTSFGRMDDTPGKFLEQYLSEVSVEPELVLHLSERQRREVKQLGFDTAELQFGTYGFRPLGIERSGLGFAGSIWHKDDEKVDTILGPFRDEPTFENVSSLAMPSQLNLWYNSKLVTFGLWKEGQRSWGIVNNRLYEALASGTPLVVERHPDITSVFGREYPYQASSRQEVEALVEKIRNDPESTLDEFATFSEYVLSNHSYLDRIASLVDYLR